MKIKRLTINENEHLFSCDSDAASVPEQNAFSILVGKNGTGKTECLIQIIGSLLRLNISESLTSPYTDNLNEILDDEFKQFQIEYQFNSRLTIIESNDEKQIEHSVFFSKSNNPRKIKKFDGTEEILNDGYFRHKFEVDNLNLIKKMCKNIIALSESPYSKFPILKNNISNIYHLFIPQNLNHREHSSVYADDFVLPQIKRLSSSIVSSCLSDKHHKIQPILDILGFGCQIKISINIKERFRSPNLVTAQALIDSRLKSRSYNDDQNYDIKSKKRSNISIKLMQAWVKLDKSFQLSRLLNNSSYDKMSALEITIDLFKNIDDFDSISSLIENDILFINKLTFFHKNDNSWLDSKRLSSGQFCLLTLFFSIASKITDNSLILIDEPEISLHPYWQAKLVPLFSKIFSSYKNCHFILATHSPHILSNLNIENTSVVIFDGETRNSHTVSGRELSSKSVDYQLAEVFEYPGFRNEYINRELISYLVKFSKGRKISSKEKKAVLKIIALEAELDREDPLIELMYAVKSTLAGDIYESS